MRFYSLNFQVILKKTERRLAMTNFEIQLDIPDIEIEKVEINTKGDILIYVKSTVEGTICSKCGRKICKYYDTDREITLRHLSILGNKTYIIIRPVRYECPYCNNKPTTTQKLPWYDQRSPHTKAYENHVLLQVVNSTIEDTSIKEELGYEAIMGILKRYIEYKVNWSLIKRLVILGLDEISLKKGHKDFVTIVTGRIDEKTIIIGVLKDRKKSTVKKFLKTIPKRLRKSIKAICSDMYEGFVNAAKEVFGKTIIVIDRFHVAKLYRKGLDGLRKKELKRLKNELTEEEYKELKGAMWILRKKKGELTDKELKVLNCLFKHSTVLEVAYNLCNDLTEIFEKDISRKEAKIEIDDWKNQVEESGLSCFKTFIKTLDKFSDGILNYFTDRQTSGFVEGLNNKIKVIKRRCYGITNIKHLYQRIHLDLGGYARFA